MKKGFTLVELSIFVVAIMVLLGATIPRLTGLSRPGPSSYRIERSLKQFVVNRSGISGAFFLASGAIGGGKKECYFYYKTKEGNKFRAGLVSLTKSSIIEDGQNKIVFVTRTLKKNKISELENEIDHWNFWGSDVEEFEFHIPPGSILEEYNPNLSSSN